MYIHRFDALERIYLEIFQFTGEQRGPELGSQWCVLAQGLTGRKCLQILREKLKNWNCSKSRTAKKDQISAGREWQWQLHGNCPRHQMHQNKDKSLNKCYWQLLASILGLIEVAQTYQKSSKKIKKYAFLLRIFLLCSFYFIYFFEDSGSNKKYF